MASASFLSSLALKMDCNLQANPFLPRLLSAIRFYHSNRKQTKPASELRNQSVGTIAAYETPQMLAGAWSTASK